MREVRSADGGSESVLQACNNVVSVKIFVRFASVTRSPSSQQPPVNVVRGAQEPVFTSGPDRCASAFICGYIRFGPGLNLRHLHCKRTGSSFSRRCFSPPLLSRGRQVRGRRQQVPLATTLESGSVRNSICVHLRSSAVTSGLVAASEAALGNLRLDLSGSPSDLHFTNALIALE
jgi:hypothetical protein